MTDHQLAGARNTCALMSWIRLCRASMAEPFESSQCVDLDAIIFIYTCILKCLQ